MIKLFTSEEIRKIELDFIASKESSFSLELMERAGKGLANELLECSEPYLFVCGKGNNGGDGFVAIRHLLEKNKKIFLFLLSEEDALSHDAKFNFKKIEEKTNFKIISKKDDIEFVNSLKDSKTIVDCILGTGVKGELSDLLCWIIQSINSSKKEIIACDIPTGLNPSTGKVLKETILASKTITFGYSKIGLHILPGLNYSGKVKTIDIGLPDVSSGNYLLDEIFIKENFPIRKKDSHKGSFGRTILVCGNNKFPGAAMLASKAASSIGSGLTSLSSPKEVLEKISSGIPEVTHIEFNSQSILNECKNATSLVIGPGLGLEENSKKIVKELILNSNIPIVLDADGINILSEDCDLLKKRKCEIVLTPHPKEFSRLINVSTSEILNDSLSLVKKFGEKYNTVLVLKGAGSIITNKGKEIFISPFSNSALSKGGTGDVLSGLIGGLISQGLSLEVATYIGVYLHGKTAEIITNEKTEYCLLPQDLISYLPIAIKSIIK